MIDTTILKLALPVPLRASFDYLPPEIPLTVQLTPGIRYLVPFGRRRLVGLLLSVETSSDIPANQLKRAIEQLDTKPIITDSIFPWLQWISDYYHHPIGETFFTALPAEAKKTKPFFPQIHKWKLTPLGRNIDPNTLTRAPKQQALLRHLQAHPQGLKYEQIRPCVSHPQVALKRFLESGWIQEFIEDLPTKSLSTLEVNPSPLQLNQEQQNTVQTIVRHMHTFNPHLIYGVTGSGKTEIYLAIIEQVIRQNRQALLLVPEISLTPQFIARITQRFVGDIGMLHSGMSDKVRKETWIAARQGQLQLILGTRSAIFAPLNELGVIILDEEHDSSYKQQEGLRYSARDVALVRAQKENIPILLGSATPCLETLKNALDRRYHLHRLTQRTAKAAIPDFRILDMRHEAKTEHIATNLLHAIARRLKKNEQVLIFLNRRGFSPVLLCRDCGWVVRCHQCDYPMTFHRHDHRLRCHHCAREERPPRDCTQCGSDNFNPLGYGTERTEEILAAHFPQTEIIRIDRDTTRKKGALQQLLAEIDSNKPQILLGTQMLAKGHDFPNLTLVGILDADQGLFGADFRSTERLAQLIIQVAGRAGRADKRGSVWLQTHQPDSPILNTLIQGGYEAFSTSELDQRRLAGFPPYSYTALFRAEGKQLSQSLAFLNDCAALIAAQADPSVQLLGPIPAPIEKRSGFYRSHLLLICQQRKPLHHVLKVTLPLIDANKSGRPLRWHVEVDPIELS